MKSALKFVALLCFTSGLAVAQTVYNTNTVTTTLPDGSVVKQTYQLTYVAGKLTARTLVSTGVVSGPKTTTPTAPTTISTAPLNYGADVGVATTMVSNNPIYYLTTEANRAVRGVNANVALARGWTGKGSTVLIMDTGINATHPDLAGKVKYSIDYTKTSIVDTNGHGTHVAGIVAAKLNGTGTYGIAPDANLAIAKIGTGTSVNMTAAQNALLWAQQYSDIVVANLSSNIAYSTAYTSSVYKLKDGTYYSKDPNYGGTNYYNKETPTGWANNLGSQMILVVAAGNTSPLYVQNPATFASATDANGKLLLGGRMIIAGNYNTTNNTISGAVAGHVCKVMASDVCQDTYRTSDFYLLAPGTGITSTYLNGTYKDLSGTSQAAPVISGAVAVINQLWPYMKGDQVAQLLFKTANKNLPRYTKETHGQGLLDLDRATQPIGALGISTTGRTGTAKAITGTLSVTGLSTKVTGTLSSVTAVDDLQRDYKVNLSGMVSTQMVQPLAYSGHSMGQSWSSKYAGVTNTANGVSVAGYNGSFSVGVSTQALDPVHQTWQHQFTLTQTQYNPWVNFGGMWGESAGATTLEYSTLYAPKPEGAWAQAGLMQTIGSYRYGMVSYVSPIYSAYAMTGYKQGGFNLYAGVKPTVVAGSIHLTVPTSVDTDGNMKYESVSSTIRNRAVGFIGTSYNYAYRSHKISLTAMAGQDGSRSGGVYYNLGF